LGATDAARRHKVSCIGSREWYRHALQHATPTRTRPLALRTGNDFIRAQ